MTLTAIAFLVAFAAGCVLALARHPIYGLLAYVGAFYLHPSSRWWGEGMLEGVRWSMVAAAITWAAIAIGGRRLQPSSRFFGQPVVIGFVLFILWLTIQSLWVLDPEEHWDLLSYYLKFVVLMYLIYRCVDTEAHLRLFLWAHVLGCFYLGWIAYSSNVGGRFEGFGGPGIGEANAGALQIVTGILAAGALFLAGTKWTKGIVMGVMPILVNALVTTISRSGFLAFSVGGVIFNLFTPRVFRRRVAVLSALGILLLFLLTNPIYWARIDTIKYRGEQVEGVETGTGRLQIIQAQWRMFRTHPLGCGHMCTTVLSPRYLPESALSAGGRSSHNTFMTMLVDHGVPGAAFYLSLVLWSVGSLRLVARRCREMDGLLPAVLPAVAGSMGAIFVADMFVQYPKFEARMWFIALIMVLLRMSSAAQQRQAPQP